MNKLIQRLGQLFAQPKKVEHVPLIYDVFDWENVSEKSIKPEILIVCRKIHDKYLVWRRTEVNHTEGFSFFNNDKSRGFAITVPSLPEYDHLVLGLIKHLTQILIAKGYVVKLSEISTKQSNTGIQTNYQVYLKPRQSKNPQNKSIQLYGNVSIEYKIEDGKSLFFRFLSHTYQDFNFDQPLPIDHLMDDLLLM